MQTSPAKRQVTRRTPAADAKLPYPKLPDPPAESGIPHAVFWLCDWLRHQAELEAYIALENLSSNWARRDKSHVLSMAMTGARISLMSAAAYSLKMVVDEGGLLFAWAGTTHPMVRA